MPITGRLRARASSPASASTFLAREVRGSRAPELPPVDALPRRLIQLAAAQHAAELLGVRDGAVLVPEADDGVHLVRTETGDLEELLLVRRVHLDLVLRH